jgi:hypothetical protein
LWRFIEETAKLVVDGIHAVHDLIGDLTELGLSRATGLGGAVDGHDLQRTVRKISVRKMKQVSAYF